MKSIPISVRIPEEDAAFIAGLTMSGATTPSEKIRVILAEARKQQQAPKDYLSCRQRAEALLEPAVRTIRESEMALETHSEVLTLLSDWLPEASAYLMASVPQARAIEDLQQLRHLEQGAVERIFRLLETVMRLAVTEQCPCYDVHVMARRMRSILDLAELIRQREAMQATGESQDR